MSVAELIKWDLMQDYLVWKYPNNELCTWSQLIVGESQEAIFVKEGKLAKVFSSGRHKLDTENYPFLKELYAIPFGGKSVYTAEIWYVNKTSVMDIKWGTAQPVELQDPKYKLIIPLTSYGQFGIRIKNSELFYKHFVGTNPTFEIDQLKKALKGVVYSLARNAIASAVIKIGKSPFELNSYLTDISAIIKNEIQIEVENLGIEIVNFYIAAISLPEDNAELNKLKAALAKKAEMDVIGYTYQEEQSYETMKTAISKGKGISSGIIETGVELGMGMKLAKGFGETINNMSDSFVEKVSELKCINCNMPIDKESKFCKHCGQKQEIQCSNCGRLYKESVKFCSDCGTLIGKKEDASNEDV
ncbi:MAG: SPFH domain-containing protein [Proteocatella sp.]